MAQGSRVTGPPTRPGDQAQQSHLQPRLSTLNVNMENISQNRPKPIYFLTSTQHYFQEPVTYR